MLNIKLHFKLSKYSNEQKVRLALALSILIFNLVGVLFSYFYNTLRFNFVFIQTNVIQLISILLISLAFFIITYSKLTKRNPTVWMLLNFLVVAVLFLYNLVGINTLAENNLLKASFSTANSVYIIIIGFLLLLITARFDFPAIKGLSHFTQAVLEHIRLNIGIYLFITFLIACLTFLNATYIYLITIVPLVIDVYLFKTYLSSIRK